MRKTMDTYTFEENKIIVIDEELGLSFQESFSPIKLPENPEQDQMLGDGYTIKIFTIEEDLLEEAYVEKDGKIDGQCLLFYPNGAIKMEVFYALGSLHGPSTFFSEDGMVLAKGWFIRGKRQGKCYWYYPSKTLSSLQRFVEGAWHDKQEYYYPNGTLKTIMHYKHGLLDGVTQLYSPEGKLIRELQFENGKLTTESGREKTGREKTNVG
jgi:antitoxin component YwqK of YwqJK toxin-antitoxin module